MRKEEIRLLKKVNHAKNKVVVVDCGTLDKPDHLGIVLTKPLSDFLRHQQVYDSQ